VGSLKSSIDDYLYSDVGLTSNIHGEIGIVNIPSSRILEEGILKLHLVNSDPINSLLITAVPFDWMEVSLRYADINTEKYSPYKSFSGDQTYKDKSFNLKLKLIEESEKFPELSIGFRDFIGTGKFSGEYIVSSKRIGDFDLSVGLGWGAFSTNEGIDNPLVDIDESFNSRPIDYGKGGNIQFDRWFRGEKASSFYGLEYLNKYSGIRFKVDYDSSNPFNLTKDSNFSYGLSIPASRFVDINLFRHRGTSIGFGVSYKANYSKNLVKKEENIPLINFNERDKILLSQDDAVFTGTINVLLKEFGIFTQVINLKNRDLEIIVDQSKYRNQNLATKRVVQLANEVLITREIENVRIVYQINNVNTGSVEFPLRIFLNYLENSLSIPELRKALIYENYTKRNDYDEIFKGEINFPILFGGIRPDIKNHIGAPEAFYSGQLGLFIGGGIKFNNQSVLDGTLSVSLFENLDQLRLKSFSRLPKVRSDIREYLKEQYAIKNLTYSYLFDPAYSKNNLFVGGIKIGLFEEMFAGIGGEILLRDINKPWYLTANYYWVKQREFNQRFSFRKYETFTGHLNFIWETPIQGVKLILSGGRYLAKDSGFTLNLSKTFKTGFVVGAFATKTDISAFEFGEGSFDKGIYFSIPLDIVSKNYRKNNARFIWKNLTRDGGAMLSGGIDLQGYVENTSRNFLGYFKDGFKE